MTESGRRGFNLKYDKPIWPKPLSGVSTCHENSQNDIGAMSADFTSCTGMRCSNGKNVKRARVLIHRMCRDKKKKNDRKAGGAKVV